MGIHTYSFLWTSPFLAWLLLQAAGGSLFPWTSITCRGTAASPWFPLKAAGESPLYCLEHLLPIFFHCPWCLHSLSHMFLLLWHQLHSFCPILKYTIPVLPPLFPMGLALASGRSILEQAGIGPVSQGEVSSTFSQSHPCSPSATQIWPHKLSTEVHWNNGAILGLGSGP